MKHNLILCSAAVLALACFASETAGQSAEHRAPATQATPATNAPSPAIKQKVAQQYGQLPLSFEANQGQADPKVKFLSRGPGYKLLLLPHEAILTLQKERHAQRAKKFAALQGRSETAEREPSPTEIIHMSLLGAAADPGVAGAEEMPGKSNYFIGNDPAQWRTNVPNYAKVQYRGVYPGIDLVYHGNSQQLEYDFVVAPGADPRQIRLALKGARKLTLTREGDLLLLTSGDPVRLYKPVIYQDLGGKRRSIDGSFVLTAKNTVKFRVGKYDASQPLIIDPVLAYSTLLGGTNGFDDAFGIAVDATGAYITGVTNSTTFATTSLQSVPKTCGTAPSTFPCDTAFVAKLNPAGNALLYVSYVGGTGTSIGSGIAVSSGKAYIMGSTMAADFPTTAGAFQTKLKGFESAFVAELSSDGAALVFSTYLGGSSSEFISGFAGGNSIGVDPAGAAYVTGTTLSSDFPTTAGSLQPSPGAGAFRSGDSAATWTPSNASLASFNNITALVVDPRAPANIYAGTGTFGVFKSTDGGVTWTASNTGLGTLKIQTLVIDPVTPAPTTTLYAGTALGVFKSVNAGATWAAANNGLIPAGTTTPTTIPALAINPSAPLTLYAADPSGVFKTIDGGANWVSLNAAFPVSPNGVSSIVIDPVTSANVYVATSFQGVFKSTNDGTNWAAASTGLTIPGSGSGPTASFFDIIAMAIDAKAPNNLYITVQNTAAKQTFTGGGVYKTADGGNTWTSVNAGLTDLTTLGIVADPTISGTVYVATASTGVFKTTNGGSSWATSNNALSNFLVDVLAVDPTAPAKLYAGSSVERAFVTKFDQLGAIGYSTFLGGSSREVGNSIAVDSQGNAYITGATESRNFPTLAAFQPTRQGFADAFLTKLNPAGSALSFSTYLGGTDDGSEAFGIALDSSNSAYITGFTLATNFPLMNAFQTSNGGENSFIAKFTPSGNGLVYSTFLGGAGPNAFDEARSIAVDSNGNAWVIGITESTDFPVVKPLRASSPGNCFGSQSACQSIFISELGPTGSPLLFSTFFGPAQFFTGGGIAVDAGGNAYVAGTASTADFPLVNPIPSSPTTAGHAFVLKLGTATTTTDLAITLSHSPDPVQLSSPVTFTAVVTNNGPSPATGVTLFPTIAPGGKSLPIFSFTSSTQTQGSCDISTGFCNIGPLAVGGTATVTLVDTPFQGGNFAAAFGVGGNESDPVPANNISTNAVQILGGADLSLFGATSPAPVTVGANLTYQFQVFNAGPSPATNVTLTDALPAGVAFVSGTSPQGSCTSTTNVVCSLGSLAVNGTATVSIVATAPASAGTITNNASVTAAENDTNPRNNSLTQVSDVIPSPNTTNNARLNGHYAFLLNGFQTGGLMAFAGTFIADGNGNITSGVADTNLQATGVTANQAFTGTYSVGSDNRGTMTFNPVGVPALTFRFALGSLNPQGIAAKARFIEFDTSGRRGSGVMELQDTTAFSITALNGGFAFGASGEDSNVHHFGAAGRYTLDGAGHLTNGVEDTNTAGVLGTQLAFTGAYTVSANGRGTLAFTFPGSTANYALYVVSAGETFFISLDTRSATTVLSSGQALKQTTASFSSASLNGVSIVNSTGLPGNSATDVTIGAFTADGVGNATVLTDENKAGVVTLNQTSADTYTVAANGRVTFAHSGLVVYLSDLNRAFLLGAGLGAASGSIEPQLGAPFSTASVFGNFFFGNLTPAALSVAPQSGESVANNGLLFTTQDFDLSATLASGFLTADVATTNSYSVSPNGRTLLGDGSILYVISPGKVVVIGAKSGKANDTVTVAESVSAPVAADLAISVAPTSASVAVGAQVTLTFTVTNLGPSPATNIGFASALPAALTLASTPVSSQGTCSPSAGGATCTLGNLANGAAATVTVVATGASAGVAVTSGSVSGSPTDPNIANNTVLSTVTVTSGSSGSTDMALTKTVSPASVIQGANLTYTLTATNAGSTPATGVKVADTLPAGVTFVSSVASQGTCTGSGTVTCNLGNLAIGASATATIVVTAGATGTITNTASVTADQTDPNSANNTASVPAVVLPAANAAQRYIIADSNAPRALEFDPATNALAGTGPTGANPEGIVISPNGRLAYIGNLNSNYTSVLDLTLNAEVARIRGTRASRAIALSGDGTKVIIPNVGADEVDIADATTFQVIKRVSLDGLVGDLPNVVDIGLTGTTAVGNFAYINTNSLSSNNPSPVAIIDLTTFAVATIPGSNIGFATLRGHIAATPDGRFVVVPRQSPDSLLIIDTATKKVVQTVSLSVTPFAIDITRNASDPNGVFGYIIENSAAGTGVAVVDLRPGLATFGQLISGAQINIASIGSGNIGVTPDGTRVIVCAANTAAPNNIIVLDAQKLRTAPATAIVTQSHFGTAFTSLRTLDTGTIQTQPPATAPSVIAVLPVSIVNDAARSLHITGTGFAVGAMVRVGALDPIAATNVTATALDVLVPQFVPAQSSVDIIVTNPNAASGISDRNISGILRGRLTIVAAAAYQPLNEVTISATGDNAMSFVNNAARTISTVAVSPNPFGQAISADGLRSYIASFRGKVVDVVNLNTRVLETSIILPATTTALGQVDAIATAVSTVTNGPAEFLLTSFNNGTNTADLKVLVIDSNPTSPTFNTVISQFAAGLAAATTPGALAVTSDGHFAYGNDANTGNMVVFNMQSGTATLFTASALSNDAGFQAHIEISSDNKSLILASATGRMLVFDIGANPINPVLVTTITGTPPAGLPPLSFSNYRIIGNRVFAFDGSQNVIQAFNFDRAANNFSALGSVSLPGVANAFSSGFAVTPDGALIYAIQDQNDSAAVLTTAGLITSSPTAQITALHVGLSPSAVVISAGQALVANLAITKTATPTTVTQGAPVTYTITVTNSGPSSSTGVIFTDPLPAGQTLVSATPSQGTCNGTTTISCSLGTLAVGASASASIVAKATALGSPTNTATASENETNPSANSSASAQITVTNASVCTGASILWTGAAVPADGQWTTPGNWNPARVPLATDDVCIDTPFAASTVTLSSSQQTIHSLVVASTIQLNGALAPTSLTITGTLNVGTNFANNVILTSATLNVVLGATSTINGTLTSSGTSSIGGSTTNTVVLNGGLTVNNGTLTVTNSFFSNRGAAVLAGNANLQLSGALGSVFDNRSTLTLSNASAIGTSAGSAITNHAGATVNISGTPTIAALVTNLGTVNVGGILNLNGGYTQTSGFLALNTGTISTNSPLAINGGILAGTGSIFGGASVSSGGVISPGFSPGTISITGPYTQASTGIYNVEIGGLTAGTQYDQIAGPTNLAAALGGILNVSLIGGFTPANGNTFTILTCAGSANCRTGTFATTNFPALPAGLSWTVTYNPTSVVLNVTNVAQADLALTKSAAPNPVTVGNNLTYTLTVTNNGPASATGVTLTDPLPAGAPLVSANSTVGSCTTTATVTCNIGTLANANAATVTIIVKPTAAGTLINTASVTATTPDPNAANNTATTSTTVTATAGCAGASNQWTGTAGDNQWGNPGNWTGGIPIATDSVCIGAAFAGSTITVNSLLAANQTVASVNSNATITFNAGPLTVTGAATFVNALNITGGLITLTLNGTSTVHGPMSITGGNLSGTGTVTLTGLLTWTTAGINGTGAVNANGGISLPSGTPLIDTKTLNVSGATTLGTSSGLFLRNGAIINNLAGSTWTLNTGSGGGIFTDLGALGTFNNAGTFQMTGGTSFGLNVPFNNTGTVNANTGILAFGNAFRQTAGITSVNGGKLTSTSPLNIQGGTLMGVDAATPPTINAAISNTGGFVQPGLAPAPGILTTSGAFTQGANGAFNVAINGTTAGTGFSQLNVVGAVTLGGALNVTLGGGFTPATGNSFTILTCSGTPTCISGTIFASTNFPTLRAGLAWNIAYNPTSVILGIGTVVTGADVSVTKTASVTSAQLGGGNFTYTITAHNNGPLAATGVTVTDPLPASVRFVSSTTSQGTCSGTATVTCALGNMANAASATITITVTPSVAASAVNTATIVASETDPVPGNNTSSATVQILPLPAPTGGNRVLVVGGSQTNSRTNSNTAEVFSVSTRTWTPTANAVPSAPLSSDGLCEPNTVLLGTGQVLIAGGGCSDNNATTNAASLYDPKTNQWTLTGSMNVGRDQFGMVTMPNGNAVAMGGCSGGCSGNNAQGQGLGVVSISTEIYDAKAGTWTSKASLTTPRASLALNSQLQGAVRLADGRTLACGGGNGFSTVFSTCEAYDPGLNSWSPTGSLPQPCAATCPFLLLPSGKVLSITPDGLGAILFDPASGTWSATGLLAATQRTGVMTRLSNGKVLLAGGTSDGTTPVNTAELYDPATGIWTLTGSMTAAREQGVTILLSDGTVLAAGGVQNPTTVLASAEIYDPVTGTWTATTSMSLPRLLPNAVALVVPPADLSVTKTASVTTTHVGPTPFTYTITVTNNGPGAATGVILNDPLPAAVQLFAAPTTSQGSCSATSPITCAIGNLAVNASATVTVQVLPAAPGSAVNTATVTGNETDPNPGNNTASATVQILPTADLRIVKTAQPSPVNVGAPLTYTLTVTSLGPANATGVTVTDALPAGVTFVSAVSTQGTCTGGNTVNCALGSMPVDAVVTVTVVVTPTAPGVIANTATVASSEFDPNLANNTSSVNVTANAVADLAVTASASPNPDGINNPLTVTLTVTNNGPSSATGVTLSNPVPVGATLVSAKPSQGSACSNTVSCALGNLAKGASATVTIVLTPTALGNLTDTATVSANETDPNPANNTATTTVSITQSSDLAVTETVNSPILFGSNFTYTFTVSNNGPSVASGITLTDTLPANVTFVGTNAPGGVICNPPAAGSFTCSIVGLAANASVGITVVVKPNAAGSFANSGTVSNGGFDPNPANNTASATGVVTVAADLSLTQTETPPTVLLGNNATFSFTVTNSGPSSATGVTIADTLPAGVTVVSATPSQGACTGFPCNLGTIANGGSATLTVLAKASTAGNLTNTASVSANEADPFPSNNTAVASFTVVASADLALSASGSPNPAGVGANLTVTLSLRNNGPSPATNVMVAGVYSGSFKFVSFIPSQGTCNNSSEFNCSFGNLPSGATATAILIVTPAAAGQFALTAGASANEPDPVTANNNVQLNIPILAAPSVTLSTGSLNFASQPVGTSSQAQSVTLTNTSPALPLTNLTIAASGDFAQTNNCGSGLAAQASCSILVTFKPTATGTRIGAVTITDNAVGSPQSVALTAIGIVAPAITLSPGSLVFSSRLVGTSSPALPITMTNSGNATLNIASIAITGTNAGDFSQTTTCQQTLAASATCAISVIFKPTGSGQRTAGVAITSDARGSVPVVTLSGTGLSTGLDLSASLLIFQNQTVATTSPAQPVTLSNASAAAVAISNIAITGDFAQTNNCGTSVAASSSCTFQVTFTPTATGSRQGSLSITGADSSNAHVVTLSGTGAVVTLSLSPASLTFADQTLGTSSQPRGITLMNTGGAALTISSIVPSGDFLETDNCGTGLAAGASCSINVAFTPTAVGPRTGLITITSNAQGSPHTAKLSGNGISTGPAVSLSCSAGSGSIIRAKGAFAAAAAPACTSLTFAAQAVGATSAAQTVTVTNAGNALLTISAITPAGDFAIVSNNCPASLAAAASCGFGVTFMPTTTGARVGAISIQDNAGDAPQSLVLTGTGTPSGPSISLSATALPFGNQLVASTSASQSVTITNNGNATLTFTSIKASGDFAETDNCANGVPAHSSCTISATFTPTATGARAGAITITDNAPASPQSVTLSGNGTDIVIAPAPGSSTSASVLAGQPATFQLSIAPAGGFTGTVTVSCSDVIPVSTCSPSPSGPFSLDAPVAVTITVTTKGPSNAMLLPSGPQGPEWLPRNLTTLRVLLQSCLALAALLAFAIAARRRRRAWIVVAAALFLVALVSGVSGCAGGSGNPGVVGQTSGTPPGLYTVTVTVKTSTGATRTFPLTVNVTAH